MEFLCIAGFIFAVVCAVVGIASTNLGGRSDRLKEKAFELLRQEQARKQK